MCTMTHFATAQTPYTHNASSMSQEMFEQPRLHPNDPAGPRFQVILAGNSFFHIKETTTGRVRGFRGDHNEACALARSLESRE